MVGWYHQLNGQEFEQTQGDNEGQGSLSCCSPWSCRVGYDLETEQQQCIVLSELIGIKAAIWVNKQNPEKKVGAHLLELEVGKFKNL